jgi:predicted RNA binding protein YcfA (HicA-like mRNA interferase family)
MKIPRDLTGAALAVLLKKKLAYEITRQKGSHIRLTTQEPSEHHITIPNHDPLKLGTLSAILSNIAAHHNFTKEELMELLFS